MRHLAVFRVTYQLWPLLAFLILSTIQALENGIDRGITFCTRDRGDVIISVEKGDFGYISSHGYPDNYTVNIYHGYACHVEIRACSTCKVRLKFVELSFPVCHRRRPHYFKHSRGLCTPGCDHLRVYEVDQPYSSVTQRNYYQKQQKSTYTSISANLIIWHCMSNSTFHEGKRFQVKYQVIDKSITRQGTFTSSLPSDSGTVVSPNFPYGYASNGEAFSYLIRNLDPYGHIRLIFDDWDIAPESELQIYDGVTATSPMEILDPAHRPVLLSESNTLIIVFNTGKRLLGCCKHSGFKGTYYFIPDKAWPERPRTDCSATYTFRTGGLIEFAGTQTDYPEFFDCIWVIKRHPKSLTTGVRLILKTMDVGEGWLQFNTNSLEVRDGLTSIGPLLTKFSPSNVTKDSSWYTSGEGFYIRLRGAMFHNDKLSLVYSAVNNVTDEGCPLHTDYLCHNLWCIDRTLMCDDIDHCGDNSDESPSLVCSMTGLWKISHWSVPLIEFTTLDPCQSGFMCHRDRFCIPSYKVCDGRLDCWDETDEENCIRGYGRSSGKKIYMSHIVQYAWIVATVIFKNRDDVL